MDDKTPFDRAYARIPWIMGIGAAIGFFSILLLTIVFGDCPIVMFGVLPVVVFLIISGRWSMLRLRRDLRESRHG